MKMTRMAIAGLVAALLFTPPASAARHTKKHGSKTAKPAPAGRAETYLKAGMENLEKQEHTAAISNFTRATTLQGGSAAYFLLGYAYYQRGFMGGSPETAEKQDALETINAYSMALALDPGLAAVQQPYRLYHSMALCYEALNSYEKAVDAYKKAFEAAPHNPMLPLYAARLRYKMNDAPKSAANLSLSLKRARLLGKEGAIVKLVRSDPLFSMMMESAQHRRVLKEYDSSIPAEATAATARTGGDVASAPAELRDSLRSAPSQPRPAPRAEDQAVTERLGAANEEFKFRRYREAIEAYNETMTLNQQSGILNPGQEAFIHERIGTSYNRLGLSHEAIRVLQRSVQQMPFNSSAHYQLALAYAVSGSYSESLRALSEAFKTAPSSGELRKYMLLAKTDSELEPVRDLPGFRTILTDYKERLQARL